MYWALFLKFHHNNSAIGYAAGESWITKVITFSSFVPLLFSVDIEMSLWCENVGGEQEDILLYFNFMHADTNERNDHLFRILGVFGILFNTNINRD